MVPPKVNFSSIPVAAFTLASNASASFKSLVASTLKTIAELEFSFVVACSFLPQAVIKPRIKRLATKNRAGFLNPNWVMALHFIVSSPV